jgi:hypothetical protein
MSFMESRGSNDMSRAIRASHRFTGLAGVIERITRDLICFG